MITSQKLNNQDDKKDSKNNYEISSCIYGKNKRNLCKNDDCDYCNNKSFSSHSKSKYWDYKKNKDKPRDLCLNSHSKRWFNCPDCKHSIEMRLDKISKGQWCRYCKSSNLCKNDDCECCNNKSFASHPKSKYWDYKKNKDKPRDLCLNSHSKRWFICPDCNHSIEMRLDNISKGYWCRYCKKTNLCDDMDCECCINKSFASHSKSKYWDYKKNKDKPRDLCLKSESKRWFICPDCNHSIEMRLYHIFKGHWCRYCLYKTEKLIFEFLSDEKINIKRNIKFDWCKNNETNRYFPFDLCIEDSEIIIEVHGPQHYRESTLCRDSTLDERKERDKYKMNCAWNNGYKLILINQEEVFCNRFDWKAELIKQITTLRDINKKLAIISCSNDMDFYKDYEN